MFAEAGLLTRPEGDAIPEGPRMAHPKHQAGLFERKPEALLREA